MKLIVGLGNPGKKYETTRHNVGFRAVEAAARELGGEFRMEEQFSAEIAEIARPGAEKIILAKPQTFMNASAKAVETLMNFYKVSPSDILIVHDEIDLPLGKTRVSRGSGAAGHRGVSPVLEVTGAQDTVRVRLGIEDRTVLRQPNTEDYVLQNFSAEEENLRTPLKAFRA